MQLSVRFKITLYAISGIFIAIAIPFSILFAPSPEHDATITVGYTVQGNEAIYVRRFDTIVRTVVEVSFKRFVAPESPKVRHDLNTTSVDEVIPLWCRQLLSAELFYEGERSDNAVFVFEAQGWPFRSAVLEHNVKEVMGNVKYGCVLQPSPQQLGGQWPYPGAIALRPILSGLLLNVALYGLMSMGMFQLLLAIRRAKRIAAGECGKCGYLLRESKRICPECGSSQECARIEMATPRT